MVTSSTKRSPIRSSERSRRGLHVRRSRRKGAPGARSAASTPGRVTCEPKAARHEQNAAIPNQPSERSRRGLHVRRSRRKGAPGARSEASTPGRVATYNGGASRARRRRRAPGLLVALPERRDGLRRYESGSAAAGVGRSRAQFRGGYLRAGGRVRVQVRPRTVTRVPKVRPRSSEYGRRSVLHERATPCESPLCGPRS